VPELKEDFDSDSDEGEPIKHSQVDSLLGLLDSHRRNFSKLKADGCNPERVGLPLDLRVSLDAGVAKRLGRLLAKTLRYIQIVRDEDNDLYTCASTMVLLAEWVEERHSAAVLCDMGFSDAEVDHIRGGCHPLEWRARAIFSWEEEASSDSDKDTDVFSDLRRKLDKGARHEKARRAGTKFGDVHKAHFESESELDKSYRRLNNLGNPGNPGAYDHASAEHEARRVAGDSFVVLTHAMFDSGATVSMAARELLHSRRR